jgi:hypothetical protein
MSADDYGAEPYVNLYPTKEELLGYDDDEELGSGETYDEVCGELDDYVP